MVKEMEQTNLFSSENKTKLGVGTNLNTTSLLLAESQTYGMRQRNKESETKINI